MLPVETLSIRLFSTSVSLFLTLSLSPTPWTRVWINSRSWWWTGRPCMLQSVGSQRVRQDWVTELNWTDSWFETRFICTIFLDSPTCFNVWYLVFSFWSTSLCMTESRSSHGGEGEGEMRWEMRFDVYALPCVRQTASRHLLRNPGSPARGSVTT